MRLFIYFLEGHLNHHYHAAYPSFCFVLFLIFAVTLGFLQGNKSVAQCNEKELFLLSSLPEQGETFYDHLFLATTVTKKTKRGRKGTVKIPHASVGSWLDGRTSLLVQQMCEREEVSQD